MSRMIITREFYIPKGAMKVSDKASDAVAYVYQTESGRPAARGFHGKRAKPAFAYAFRSEAEREKHIRQFFANVQGWHARKAEAKARERAPSKLQLGHILSASWGYDQTNVDWYQVTRLISPTMVELRKIASTSTGEDGYMTGRCMPCPDEFIGEPMRKRVQYGDRVRVTDCSTASLWEGRPLHWSSTH